MIKVLVLGLFCAEMVVAQTDLGTHLSSSVVATRSTLECAATLSQTYPCLKDMKLNGIRFLVIGYDSKTRRVKYLLTDDKHFVTREGFRVGANIELAEDTILAVPGWEIFGPTTVDGWRTILGSAIEGQMLRAVDGTVIDLSNAVPGRTHVFTIVGFEKGGV